MTDKTDLLQGTLDLLVLRVLRTQELHGWGISKRIREISRDVLQVNQGSLYPALYRLERQGHIEADWGISEEGRRAKFYHITALGKKQLATAESAWRRFSIAVELVLTTS
jgi:PadR family transcriptional regulator PadR